jgi:hypothetical protein
VIQLGWSGWGITPGPPVRVVRLGLAAVWLMEASVLKQMQAYNLALSQARAQVAAIVVQMAPDKVQPPVRDWRP